MRKDVNSSCQPSNERWKFIVLRFRAFQTVNPMECFCETYGPA